MEPAQPVHKKNTKPLERYFRNEKTRKYPRNQIILHQDDKVNFVFYISKGYVKVYTILSGGEERTVAIHGPGEIFPDTSSVIYHDKDEYSLKHYFQALDDVQVRMVDANEFRKMLFANPELMLHTLDHLSNANEELMQHLEVVKSKTAQEKILQVLPYLIKKCGRNIGSGKYRLVPKIIHQDIADLAGLTRETASLHLKELADNKVLIQNNTSWVIDDTKLQKLLPK